jgi:hypothetical protein
MARLLKMVRYFKFKEITPLSKMTKGLEAGWGGVTGSLVLIGSDPAIVGA